jgi:kumamolisin
MNSNYIPVPLPASFRAPLPGKKYALAPHASPIQVTVILSKEASIPQFIALEEFATDHKLEIIERDEKKRRMKLQGPSAYLMHAFNTHLEHVVLYGRQIRARSGMISVPAALAQYIVGVFGLDNRPVAKPHIKYRAGSFQSRFDPATRTTVRVHEQFRAGTGSTMAKPLTAPQVAKAYNFPMDATGKGVTIAIIELGGGFADPDLAAYFDGLTLPTPAITAVGIDGAANIPGSDADGEVMLDIEVAGAIAPGASLAVYFADNTDQGFINAVLDAGHDPKTQVISISWGMPEDQWTAQALGAMNAALHDAAELGKSIFVASGDAGSTDGDVSGAHVDFPAASEYVTACGGTLLMLNADGTRASETVWNDNNGDASGGGVSKVFGFPAYQHGCALVPPGSGVYGRGVPDVAGNASPDSGYEIIVDGQAQVVGGTSAVSPLFAGLAALLIEKRGGKSIGLLNSIIYRKGKAAFHDVTTGNNGAYTAAAGWDCCTGLGVVDGAALTKILD